MSVFESGLHTSRTQLAILEACCVEASTRRSRWLKWLWRT